MLKIKTNLTQTLVSHNTCVQTKKEKYEGEAA